MTDQKPNCSNCPYLIPFNPDIPYDMHKCNHPDIEKDDLITRTITVDEYCRTFVLGCLSHPDAKAYLMRGVLEKLERAVNIETSTSECDDLIYEAISLIKGGKG